MGAGGIFGIEMGFGGPDGFWCLEWNVRTRVERIGYIQPLSSMMWLGSRKVA
jgi:hypothetical protein